MGLMHKVPPFLDEVSLSDDVQTCSMYIKVSIFMMLQKKGGVSTISTPFAASLAYNGPTHVRYTSYAISHSEINTI